MKSVAVCGFTKSGKTTTVINVLPHLIASGLTVGTIKDIHFEGFAMDTEGKNTYLHAKAGACIVTARGIGETDVMYKRRMNLNEILPLYPVDFVLCEGFTDQALPKVIVARTIDQLEQLVDDTTIAISGVITNELTQYKGIPVINALTDADKLSQLILDKAFEVLPLVDSDCCTQCGKSCYDMCGDIVQGRATRSDCQLSSSKVRLTVGGKEIPMVPFVASIVRNNVLAVVGELNGFKSCQDIVVEIDQ